MSDLINYGPWSPGLGDGISELGRMLLQAQLFKQNRAFQQQELDIQNRKLMFDMANQTRATDLTEQGLALDREKFGVDKSRIEMENSVNSERLAAARTGGEAIKNRTLTQYGMLPSDSYANQMTNIPFVGPIVGPGIQAAELPRLNMTSLADLLGALTKSSILGDQGYRLMQPDIIPAGSVGHYPLTDKTIQGMPTAATLPDMMSEDTAAKLYYESQIFGDSLPKDFSEHLYNVAMGRRQPGYTAPPPPPGGAAGTGRQDGTPHPTDPTIVWSAKYNGWVKKQ